MLLSSSRIFVKIGREASLLRIFSLNSKSKPFGSFLLSELLAPTFTSARDSSTSSRASLQLLRKMRQSKIGQFFKKKPEPAESNEGEGAAKKILAEAEKSPVKQEHQGRSSVPKAVAVSESPSERKRKSKTLEESDEEEEVVKVKSAVKSEKGNASKKPRRRIIVQSSSENEDRVEENEVKSRSSSSDRSLSPEPKGKTPTPEKAKMPPPKSTNGKATPKAKTKAKTPVKKATPKGTKLNVNTNIIIKISAFAFTSVIFMFNE
jgi:hypothetical protein